MASNSKNIAELLNGDVTIEAVDIATGAVTGAKLSNNFNYDSGTLYLDSTNNKVGIGETSPLGKLHIKEGDSGVTSVSTDADQLVIENNAESGISILAPTNSASRIAFGDSDNNKIGMIYYNHSSNFMKFDVNNAERIRIDTDGRFIISSNTTYSNTPFTGYGAVMQNGTDGTVHLDSYSSGGGTNLAFGTNTGGGAVTEIMRLTSALNVGIGTQAPAEKLSVNGNIRLQSGTNPTRIQYFNSGANYNLGVSGGAAIAFHDTAGSQEIAFETHYTGNYHREVMRLDKFGNHTVPHQPAFWAYRSGNWTGWTPNNQTQVVPFNAEYHDLGGNFNTSNGLFTCPVAGEYMFTAGVYVGVTSVEQIWLVKAGGRSITIGFPNAGTTGDRIVGSVVIRCSANDTIGICPYANSGTTSTVFANFHHTFFLGALIN